MKKFLNKLLWWLVGESGGGKSGDQNQEENTETSEDNTTGGNPEENEIKAEETIEPEECEPEEIQNLLVTNYYEKKFVVDRFLESEVDPDQIISIINTYYDNDRKYIFKIEHFPSIRAMIKILSGRPNNEVMKNCKKSDKSEIGWRSESYYGNTSSYKEALELYFTGYSEILDRVKKGISDNVARYFLNDTEKSRVINDVVGYIPNIPSVLMNLPNSMIYRKNCPKKNKTLEITYIMEGEGSLDKDLFINSGITMLSVIEILERQKISVKLNICCHLAYGCEELIACTVKVKDFGERLNILKLCFPVAHPSMFRRIGFKFIETFPDLTDPVFNTSYGFTMELNGGEEYLRKNERGKSFMIDAKTIHRMRYLDNPIKEIINKINKYVLDN